MAGPLGEWPPALVGYLCNVTNYCLCRVNVPVSGGHMPRGATFTPNRSWPLVAGSTVYTKQTIFELTQEWFRELSFSRLECGVSRQVTLLPPMCDRFTSSLA